MASEPTNCASGLPSCHSRAVRGLTVFRSLQQHWMLCQVGLSCPCALCACRQMEYTAFLRHKPDASVPELYPVRQTHCITSLAGRWCIARAATMTSDSITLITGVPWKTPRKVSDVPAALSAGSCRIRTYWACGRSLPAYRDSGGESSEVLCGKSCARGLEARPTTAYAEANFL